MPANPITIFLVFLRLGCTSFGGPIAHLGYFREEFVSRRKWLDDETYADIVALAQFVPGPASSQTGFALGLMHGGLAGALAAFLGFTLPSALLMIAAAYGLSLWEGQAVQGLIHGLKVLAVAVVAQAVWSMGRTLCPDAKRAAFALVIAAILIVVPSGMIQVAAIAAGAVFGLATLNSESASNGQPLADRVSRVGAVVALALFSGLLFGLPFLAAVTSKGWIELLQAFYSAGALVFGGGHVVLPLLQESTVQTGWVASDTFLAGYGAAQALPGPVFAFAAFLGYQSLAGPGGIAGALIALFAIFLPGFLLMYGTLPFWDRLRRDPAARAAMGGVNAAVVGILGAALYNPIWLSTIFKPLDAALALVLFAMFAVLRLPVLAVVLTGAIAGMAMELML